VAGPKDIRRAFSDSASPDAKLRREGLPDPAKLTERGIITKESLDWRAAQKPQPPELTYEIDRADIRRDAVEEARADLRTRINRLREEFRARPEKARRDFGTARDYRRSEHER